MSKIVIFFPGIGYTCDKPLLYYSRKLSIAAGYDKYINLGYSYKPGKIRGNITKMKETYEIIYAQTEKFLESINFNDYDDVLFVSKSIGTVVAVAYSAKHHIENIRHVLYTPLIYTFEVISKNDNFDSKRAISFIGLKDPWSNVHEVIDAAQELNIPIYTYEEADHSLEEADTLKNISIMKDVMDKTKAFI